MVLVNDEYITVMFISRYQLDHLFQAEKQTNTEINQTVCLDCDRDINYIGS